MGPLGANNARSLAPSASARFFESDTLSVLPPEVWMGESADEGGSRGAPQGVRPGALSALLQEIVQASESGAGGAWTQALRPGLSVGKFELLRELGRGGFGVVWEAKDLELGRPVAFKAVRTGGKTPVREERLLREAEAAARLSHPNIVTLFDVGRAEEGPYLVLELLRGQTLMERLSQGPLPVPEAVRIAVEVAKGLAHAHAQGVVHRDLKPGNVFLCQDGQVKVLDFGLAHAFGQRLVEGGTSGYMAPEQAEGAPEDERTDVFALGVILFEMLSGKLPFGDEKALRSTNRAPVLEVPGEPALGELVSRMLSKRAVERPRDGGEVLAALQAFEGELRRAPMIGPVRARRRPGLRLAVLLAAGIAVGAAVAGGVAWWRATRTLVAGSDGRIVVAVADFANETGERELDALSGLLITSLEQSRWLAVMTRTRMLDLARQGGNEPGTRIDEVLGREIGRRAGARALLVPAMHRFDGTYTVELRAIDPQRDAYLFTLVERATGKGSIPELIDRLGERARRELREPEGDVAARRVRVAEAVTGNLEAYEHYFRGVQLQETTRYELAIAEYRNAARIDPTFALAYYRIAYAGFFHNLPASETRAAIEAAVRHVDRVPEKDRLLLQAWAAKLGARNEEAERAYARAVKAYPDDKQVSFMAGEHLIHWGKFAESLPAFERAVELDPTWEWARFHVVDDLLAMGRFVEALERARRWVAEKPDADTWRWLSRALTANGRFEEAEEAGRRAMATQIGPWNFPQYWSRFAVLDALIRQDRFADAEKVLAPVVAPSAAASDRARGVPALVEILSYQGRRREALRLLDAFRFEGASAENRIGLQIQQLLASGGRVRTEADHALQLGLPGRQLATWVAMGGELERAAELAADLEAGSPERLLHEAVADWRRGDLSGASSRFTALAARTDLDYAAFSRFALGEIAFAAGRDAEAISMLEAFARTPVVSWRWGTPPPEIYRWFFAGSFRAWAYPRSLYLMALAHHRKGDDARARHVLDHLLAIWRQADPDLALLRETKALRRQLEERPVLRKMNLSVH